MLLSSLSLSEPDAIQRELFFLDRALVLTHALALAGLFALSPQVRSIASSTALATAARRRLAGCMRAPLRGRLPRSPSGVWARWA